MASQVSNDWFWVRDLSMAECIRVKLSGEVCYNWLGVGDLYEGRLLQLLLKLEDFFFQGFLSSN